MTLLIFGLYFLLLAIFLILSLFIAYHLKKYTLNPRFRFMMLLFFSVVSAGLFLSNVLLFLSLDWKKLISFISF